MNASREAAPSVTVVMPVFNGARTLDRSVASVLDQSFTDLELLIVDDASSDASAALAEGICARDPRVRLVRREVCGGPAAARNTALALARGRFVAFCDADDLWLPAKLERQLALAAATGAALVYCGYHRVDADFSGSAEDFVPEGRVVHVPERASHAALLRRNLIGNLTAVVDRDVTGDISMPDLPGAEDWALWLRIVREHGPAAGIDEPLALYRAAQTGSHSSDRWRAIRAVWAVLRRQEGLGPLSAAAHLGTGILAALRKGRI